VTEGHVVALEKRRRVVVAVQRKVRADADVPRRARAVPVNRLGRRQRKYVQVDLSRRTRVELCVDRRRRSERKVRQRRGSTGQRRVVKEPIRPGGESADRADEQLAWSGEIQGADVDQVVIARGAVAEVK